VQAEDGAQNVTDTSGGAHGREQRKTVLGAGLSVLSRKENIGQEHEECSQRRLRHRPQRGMRRAGSTSPDETGKRAERCGFDHAKMLTPIGFRAWEIFVEASVWDAARRPTLR
jgi:hypothetical protein